MAREALLVLGMHRSGTSALAGMLSILGAKTPASLIGPSQYNEKGFFESGAIKSFNNKVLAAAGSAWDDWRPLNQAWFKSRKARKLAAAIPTLLEAEFGAAELFVLKDPRICRFTPFWLDALKAAQIDAKIVLPLRNPLHVAQSLRTRSIGKNAREITISEGLRLWLRHCFDAELTTRACQRTFVDYDDLLADWRPLAARIAHDLNLVFPRNGADADAQVQDFLTVDLRHSAPPPAAESQEDLARLALDAYAALLAQMRAEDRSRVDTLRDAFNARCAQEIRAQQKASAFRLDWRRAAM